MRYALLVLIALFFIGVFYLILSPEELDPRQVDAWRKLTSAQKRILATHRLPVKAQDLKGDRILKIPEDFGPLDFQAEPLVLTWNDLTSFSWSPGAEIPGRVRLFHGKYVRLFGSMVATEPSPEFARFVLVRSPFFFCFGPPPRLNEMVFVHLAHGSTRYEEKPVFIIGRLSVGEEQVGDQLLSLYRIEAIRMEDPSMLFQGEEH